MPKVSMPYDRLFSFLLTFDLSQTREESSVSMPYDGLFSFLHVPAVKRYDLMKGVNAL